MARLDVIARHSYQATVAFSRKSFSVAHLVAPRALFGSRLQIMPVDERALVAPSAQEVMMAISQTANRSFLGHSYHFISRRREMQAFPVQYLQVHVVDRIRSHT